MADFSDKILKLDVDFSKFVKGIEIASKSLDSLKNKLNIEKEADEIEKNFDKIKRSSDLTNAEKNVSKSSKEIEKSIENVAKTTEKAASDFSNSSKEINLKEEEEGITDSSTKIKIAVAAIGTALVGVSAAILLHSEESRAKTKEVFSDIAQSIDALAPIFFEKVNNLFSKMGPAISKFAAEASTWIGTAVEKIGGFVSGFAPRIVQIISNVLSMIGRLIESFAPKLVSFISNVLSKIGSFIGGCGPQLINAVGKVIDGIVLVIQAAIPKILSQVQGILSSVAAYLQRVYPILSEKISEMFTAIGRYIKDNAPKIQDAVFQIIEVVSGFITSSIPKIVSVVINILDKIANALIDSSAIILSSVKKILERIVDEIKNIFAPIIETVKNGIEQVLETIKSGFDRIKNDIFSKFRKDVVDEIKDTVDEVNKELSHLGADTVESFEKKGEMVVSAFRKETVNGVKDTVDEANKELSHLGEVAFKNFGEQFGPSKQLFLDSLKANATATFTEIEQKAAQTGEVVAASMEKAESAKKNLNFNDKFSELNDNFKSTEGTATSFGDKLKNVFGSIGNTIKNCGASEGADKIKMALTGVATAATTVAPIVTTLFSSIKGAQAAREIEDVGRSTAGTGSKFSSLSGIVERLKNVLTFGTARNEIGSLGRAVDGVNVKFSKMQMLTNGVMQAIGYKAVNGFTGLVKKITAPIFTKGQQRSINLEQANFKFEGIMKDANQVKAAMESCNDAVDGTAYGLDQAALVGSQFAASGMKAGTEMTKALRAVSGVAAMTGSDFESIGYLFSSVAGNGYVSGGELTRLSMRGINARAELAKYLGKTEAEITDMASEKKISWEQFYTAMDESFGEHAKDANKTYSGAMANMGAAWGRVGETFYTPLHEMERVLAVALIPRIDDFKKNIQPIVDLFTKLTEWVGNFGKNILDNLDMKWVTSWTWGILNGIESIRNICEPFIKVLKELFPIPETKVFTDKLFDAGKSLRDYFHKFGDGTPAIQKCEEAAQKFKEKIEQLKIKMADFKEALKIDQFTSGFSKIVDDLKTFAKGVIAPFKQVEETVKEPIDTIGRLMATKSFSLSDKKGPIDTIGRLMATNSLSKEKFGPPTFGEQLGTNFAKGWEGIKTGMSAFSEGLIKMAPAVADGIKLIGEGLTFVVKEAGKLFQWVGSLGEKFAAFAKDKRIFEWINDHLLKLFDIIRNRGSGLLAFLSKIKDGIFGLFNKDKKDKNGEEKVSVFDKIKKTVDKAGPVMDKLKGYFGGFGAAIKEFFDKLDIDAWISRLNKLVGIGIKGSLGAGIGYLGSIFRKTGKLIPNKKDIPSADVFGQLFNSIKKGIEGLGGGKVGEVINSVKNGFDALGKAADEQKKKGIIETVKEIAKALLMLSASAVMLAMVDSKGLAQSFAAIAGLMGVLLGGQAGTNGIGSSKISNSTEILKQVKTLNEIAKAIAVMSVSLKLLSTIDTAAAFSSVGVITILLGEMTAISAALQYGFKKDDDNERLKIKTDPITKMVKSLVIITASIMVLGNMDAKKLVQGGVAVAAIMGVLVAVQALMACISKINKNTSEVKHVSDIIPTMGILMLARTVKTLGKLEKKELVQGVSTLGVIMLALTSMSALLHCISLIKPKEGGSNILETAGSVAIAAGAILIIGKAIKKISSIGDWNKLGMGLVGMVAAMGTLVGGIALLSLINGNSNDILKISGALTIASVGITIFASAMKKLGELSIEQTIMGLTAIVGIFAVLGLAGLGLKPVSVNILALSGSVLMLAAGMSLVALAISAGLNTLVSFGDVSEAQRKNISETIKVLAGALGEGITIFAQKLSEGSESLKTAISTILSWGLSAIQTNLPIILDIIGELINGVIDVLTGSIDHIAELIRTIFQAIIDVVNEFIPKLVELGFNILMSLLGGIRDHISEIVQTAIDVVLEFIDGIGEKIDDVVQKGIWLIGQLADAFTSPETLGYISDACEKVITNVATALGSFFGKIREVGKNALKAFLNAFKGESTEDTGKDLGDEVAKGAENSLGINSPSKRMKEIGKYTVQGLVNGIRDNIDKIKMEGKQMGSALTKSIKPAVETFKQQEKSLFDNSGLKNSLSDLKSATKKIGTDISDSAKGYFGKSSNSPKITPVLDFSKAGNSVNGFTNTLKPLASPMSLDISSSIGGQIDAKINNNGIENQLSSINKKLDTSFDTSIMEGYLADISSNSNKDIYIDGTALVGATVGSYDTALGKRETMKTRRKL